MTGSEIPNDDTTSIIPAAVVCTICGRSDCLGCRESNPAEAVPTDTSIPAWETQGDSTSRRFWRTVVAATQTAPVFFRTLPSGNTIKPLAFAILAETLAVGSWGVLILIVALIAKPRLLITWMATGPGWAVFGRMGIAALACFTLTMVVGHLAWGWSIDRSARARSGQGRLAQGMRFGFYSTAWDWVTSPIGVLVSLRILGISATGRLLWLAIQAPGRSVTQFARDVYGLPHDAAALVSRDSGIWAVAIGTALSVLATTVVVLAGFL